MTTRVISAHVPEDVAVALDQLASRLDRSKNWIVREALTDFLALEEERHRLTLEGLAEIERGQVVEHAEIRTWADRLVGAPKA